MFNFILFNYMIFLTYSFFISLNPMLMILGVICLVSVVATISYIWISKWLFYVFILFYLGGMMILFIYMISLTMSYKITFITPMKKMGLFFIFCFLSLKSFESPFLTGNNMELNIMYFKSCLYLIIFLSIFLLLILWVVVKFSKMWMGPMKSSM